MKEKKKRERLLVECALVITDKARLNSHQGKHELSYIRKVMKPLLVNGVKTERKNQTWFSCYCHVDQSGFDIQDAIEAFYSFLDKRDNHRCVTDAWYYEQIVQQFLFSEKKLALLSSSRDDCAAKLHSRLVDCLIYPYENKNQVVLHSFFLIYIALFFFVIVLHSFKTQFLFS